MPNRFCGVVVCLVCACPPPGDSMDAADMAETLRTPSFSAPMEYPVGAVPFALAIDDLNADGRPDVAVARADSMDAQVAVLLGREGGTLAQRTSYSTGDTPYAIAIADVNRDRRPDLILANYLGQSVSVHLNPGSGMFTTRREFPAGTHPIALAAADTDGTGRISLLVANQVSRSLSVLSGPGDGTFPGRLDIQLGAAPAALAAVDVDADRLTDLLVVVEAGLVHLRGTGGGRFARQDTYLVGERPSAVVTGDWNGDGRPDAAVLSFGSATVTLLLARQDGSFQDGGTLETAAEPTALAAGDLDGDGRLDLVVPSSAGSLLRIFQGRGDGTFRTPLDLAQPRPPGAIALGDLDRDGKLDMVVSHLVRGSISVLLNTTR